MHVMVGVVVDLVDMMVGMVVLHETLEVVLLLRLL